MNNTQKMKLKLIEKGILTTGFSEDEVKKRHFLEFGSADYGSEPPITDPKRKPKKDKEQPKTENPRKKRPTPREPQGALEAAIANIVDDRLEGFDPKAQQIDEKQIVDLINEHATTTLHVEVKTKGKTTKIDQAHKALPELVAWLGADEHVYMHGPAGSGKTTLATQAAEALGRPFYKTGAVLSKYELVGFVDGAGAYHKTAFREAWEEGAVFLFDEMDSSAAEAIVAINDALSNGTYTFPDKAKAVPMGKGFRAIGAGNTTGTGATRQYVGRNPLDAASRDRFKVMEIGYDEDLERRLGLNAFKQYGGKEDNQPVVIEYMAELLKARKEADKRGFHVVVSPRGTVRVAKAVALKLPAEAVRNEIYNGFTVDQRKQLGAR